MKAVITGRIKKPLKLKLNPLWWFKNDDDKPPPGYTAWTWFLRNPMHNLTFYVIGVADRNFIVYGREPKANLSVRRDIGLYGWHWAILLVGLLPLPWISYTGSNVLWYAGWQPSGKLGLKWSHRK